MGKLKMHIVMDRLNQIAISDESLQYNFKGDLTIPIGILGMVDDILSVSECGIKTIEKTSVINSFMETHRILLSSEKSVVLHYGNTKKCATPCPTLKVHLKKICNRKRPQNTLVIYCPQMEG